MYDRDVVKKYEQTRKDTDDLISKIRFYLKHEQDRECIIDKGYEYIYNLTEDDIELEKISYDFGNLPNKYVSSKNVAVLTWTIRSKEQEKQALAVANNVIFENYIPDSPTNY